MGNQGSLMRQCWVYPLVLVNDSQSVVGQMVDMLVCLKSACPMQQLTFAMSGSVPALDDDSLDTISQELKADDPSTCLPPHSSPHRIDYQESVENDVDTNGEHEVEKIIGERVNSKACQFGGICMQSLILFVLCR